MAQESSINRIKELTELLNRAGLAYYQEGREIMPNIEYDAYYDELLALEEQTGFRMTQSPTQNVGYEIISQLPKERHETPMLSLDKTKEVSALKAWMGKKECVLSWKLDGITCVLTYEGGALTKAVTRGNGEIGEVVTGNARTFINIPGSIPFKGKLVIRGEAVISYSDFDSINAANAGTGAKYKNPRNLCSGSVRQLDPSVTAARRVRLIAFSLVSADNADGSSAYDECGGTFTERFRWLKGLGFEVVEHISVTSETIEEGVLSFKERIASYDIPSDGLVLSFDDIAYGLSLGRTAKFPRNQIAFKWQDEQAETVLRAIDWSGSRTGLINPVAVFDPVELEGTTVSRASVHNLSIMEELSLGIGDIITVYKANMIIPQISGNLTRSGNIKPPETCPVCGGPARIRHDNAADLLYCTNAACPAKKVKSYALMVSRDALNVEGLSEMTLEKLIDNGFIRNYADIFRLEGHRDEIAALEGFGEKSASNLIDAAKRASTTELYRFLYSLGIPGIGLAGSKAICRNYGNDLAAVLNADEESLKDIKDIGGVLAKNYTAYFADGENMRAALELASMLIFIKEEAAWEEEQVFSGLTFCITGDVYRFKNRREVQDVIERLGGKAAGSVSSKTSYLINNDVKSQSSKNKKAAALGVPVISEEDFINMLPEGLKP